jgi:shikimate dehydrogenase
MSEAPLIAGIVGHPIGHSRSPALHGHWLKRHQINGHYVPLDIAPQHFESAIRALPKLGFKGINVTIPYKETILSLADKVSDRAALIGAANTISFREDRGIYADNTDGYGFRTNLEQSAPDWSARSGPALVLGAGGASRAVLAALVQAGAPEIRLANRTKSRAETLRDRFGARITVVDWIAAEEAMSGAATIVNTTSLGMTGQPEMTLGFRHAPGDTLVTDIVYNPLRTPFLRAAQEEGLRTVDGLGMLLHQAAPGFEHWFSVSPTVDEDLRQGVLAQ